MQFHDYQPKGSEKPKLHVNIPPNEEGEEKKKATPKKRGPRKTQLIDAGSGNSKKSGEPSTPVTPLKDEGGVHKRKKFRATFPMVLLA
jgi:hypothetical protein